MKLLKLLIIPVLLTLGYSIWVTYPYFFSKINRYDSLGFLSVIEEKDINIQRTFSPQRRTDKLDSRLLAGEKAIFKFKSSENNVGIVLARFERFGKVGKLKDRIIFRIKEEGATKWYYENIYRSEEFQLNEYFTFGFSPIANSKNKVYLFEFESISGAGNGVGISPVKPPVALVYRYTQSDLTNYRTLSSFVFKKFVYVGRNVNLLENWQLLAIFVLSLLVILFMQRRKITGSDIIRLFPNLKKNHRKILKGIINNIKSNYLSFEKKIVNFSRKTTRSFTSSKFYLLFLNTNKKKRMAIALLIFLIAFLYRFSATLVHQEGVTLFYAGLGGQGDYDQFIRAATCAVTNFCSAILGQNFLFEASILGMFYKIFGFTGGLKAYLYLMLIVSSIVATFSYLLLSRKNWITIGGLIGSIFLATSDFLTHVALNFPPDNGSLFTFSIFFIVYFLTLHFRTIGWLLLFGLMGLMDGLNKALFLINDLGAFLLFIPVFLYEKTKRINKFPFIKLNLKLIFNSFLPLLIFLVIYSAWEYLVYVKFSAYYFLRGLIQSRGESYIIYTSFNDSSLGGNILSGIFYLFISAIVMIKRLLEYADLQIIFLVPIFLGLLFFFFIERRRKGIVKKFILVLTLSFVSIMLIIMVKNNYFKIHEIFAGEYILGTWTDEIYIKIFLFWDIIVLFILNFRYSAIRLSLPILPYVIMLIIMTKNSPFPRISTQVVAWSVILFAYIIDWIIMNINGYSTKRIRIIFASFNLILFVCVYSLPKMVIMISQLNSGMAESQNKIRYLKWVDSELPKNAIVLAGGKSDLVTVAENIKRPIVYNTLWNAAVLIKPKEIPGVKPSDFHALSVLKINEISGVKPSDFSIIPELKNKDNFKENKYVILEDDIYIWRDRVTGVVDNIFSTSPNTLHADDYTIKVYKFNPALKKAIYELNTR